MTERSGSNTRFQRPSTKGQRRIDDAPNRGIADDHRQADEHRRSPRPRPTEGSTVTAETHFRGNVTQKAVTVGPRGDVLLVQHPEGTWVLPGGRVNAGEAAEAALVREMREETSLRVTVERPVLTGTDLWSNDDGEPMFTVVYRCATEERAVTLNDEHDDHVWLTPAKAARQVRGERLGVAVERATEGRG